MSQKYQKLKTLLRELFQLDQPDLDFGIYRILHARSAEISQFLDQDLLPQVREILAQHESAEAADARAKLQQRIDLRRQLGDDPEQDPEVQRLRALITAAGVPREQLEAEVYDHLYGFFRRYYSKGDFLSKRVYKPGIYAIPYEGEEVKLHWANADQYYIKTSEYLRDYAFRLRPDDPHDPMRVHFRLVDAAEGEHGNVKEAQGKERRFKLASEQPITEEDGELVIRFTYQIDTAKQAELNEDAEAMILTRLTGTQDRWANALRMPHLREDGSEGRTRLFTRLEHYAKRNTFDYFIHKDLGTFLRRELDFYVKNEVIHLEDIERQTAPRVEQYLSKVEVIRRIAGKLIDFLAQLEDFQKRLWLKKKFVVETYYCISLSSIPSECYGEIGENGLQLKEWESLLDIGRDAEGAMSHQGGIFTESWTSYPTAVIDSRNFEDGFIAKVVDSIADLDGKIDGLVAVAENSNALRLLGSRYQGQVDCIYMDPPYNTGKDGFLYKDSYQHSTWASMIYERVLLARSFLTEPGAMFVSIDEGEHALLRMLVDSCWGKNNHLVDFVWITEGNFDNQAKIKIGHEYVSTWAKNEAFFRAPPVIDPAAASDSKLFNEQIRNTIVKNGPKNPPSEILLPAGFPADFESGKIPFGSSEWPRFDREVLVEDYQIKTPVAAMSGWSSKALCEEFIASNFTPVMDSKGQLTRFVVTRTGAIESIKRRSENPSYVTSLIRQTGTVQGTSSMLEQMGTPFPSYPKPVGLVRYLISMLGRSCNCVFDFFAGSGTTGHAVIDLNREDGGRRRFVLVDMASYVEDTIVPRIKKVTYAPEWKDGKPKRYCTAEEAGRSLRILKVVRLESYEDTLNNLDLRRTERQASLLDLPDAGGSDGLKEQYLLRYMLDVESRGSASLLNVRAFTDPTAYKLKVKCPGSDESREVNVDLIETFNWLIGLTVQHYAAPRVFSAEFERDSEGRLTLQDRLKPDATGPFWLRPVTGTLPDGRKALVVWRKLTGDFERDNLVLDTWFGKQGYSSKDSEFDLIYVNGSCNLENLKTPDDHWKVRLIEEDFHRLMFAEDAL